MLIPTWVGSYGLPSPGCGPLGRCFCFCLGGVGGGRFGGGGLSLGRLGLLGPRGGVGGFS